MVYFSSITPEPVAPAEPVASIADITAYTITINWIVPELTYGRENYTVWLGTTVDDINISAGTVTSTSDLTATDQLYSLTISSLTPGSQYYFMVVSRNLFTSSTSATLNSPTLILGMYIYMHV